MLVSLHLCVLLAVCSLSASASQSSSYGERGSDLGLQLFLRVVQDKPLENVVMSPHGVASVLGMLLPGAHGDTRRQILTGLKYKKTGVCVCSSFAFLQHYNIESDLLNACISANPLLALRNCVLDLLKTRCEK